MLLPREITALPFPTSADTDWPLSCEMFYRERQGLCPAAVTRDPAWCATCWETAPCRATVQRGAKAVAADENTAHRYRRADRRRRTPLVAVPTVGGGGPPTGPPRPVTGGGHETAAVAAKDRIDSVRTDTFAAVVEVSSLNRDLLALSR